MKKRFFVTELKRNAYYLPVAVISALALTVLVMALSYVYYTNGPMTQKDRKYIIGVVGNVDEKYLDYGIGMMEKADTSGSIFTYRSLNSEKEAVRLRGQGKIDAYIVVPDGWMSSVVTGRNDKKIKVVTADGQKGMTSILVDRILDTASTLFTDSQSAVFSTQEVLQRLNYKNTDELRDKYNIEIFLLAERRSRLSRLKQYGEINGLSLPQSVAVGALLFTLLLMGITNTPLFVRRNDTLLRMISAKGAEPSVQVMLSYLAYLAHYVVILAAVTAALVIPVSFFRRIPAGIFFVLIPVAVLFTSFQFFLFEITSGVVNSMLIQFTVAVVMSYVSGYFYMENFFPPVIRTIGKILPTGAAFTAAADTVTEGFTEPLDVLILFIYAAFFVVQAMVVRTVRIKGRYHEND